MASETVILNLESYHKLQDIEAAFIKKGYSIYSVYRTSVTIVALTEEEAFKRVAEENAEYKARYEKCRDELYQYKDAAIELKKQVDYLNKELNNRPVKARKWWQLFSK